jgi:C4-dicarboxylate-specific signal transduction histidine kinase
MMADRHKVLQILVNLISNAKHAMADSPVKTLTLWIEMADRAVRIAVRDTGYGIAPENMTRIFSHGFTTKTDGHGFGLHSGALAAQELGGSLQVTSDGPGRGAVFTLELPLTGAHAIAA